MKRKSKDGACCGPKARAAGCCSVESVVTVDERGQMVLPKEIREKAGIGAGDKLAVIGCEEGGKMCCITLIKADDLKQMVRNRLGPMMRELFED